MTDIRGISRRLGAVTAAAAVLSLSLAGAALTQDSSDPVEMTEGNPDAQVVLTEYASFTCPHCASFHEIVYPQLKKNYIDTGKILFRLREVYFDRPGLWAGLLARCGGPEKYFGIVDLLFKSQPSWSGRPTASEIVSRLMEIGRAAGLSTEAINACFSDAEKAQKLVEIWEMNRDADNIYATPTFILNGESYSNMSFEQLSDLLEEALGA